MLEWGARVLAIYSLIVIAAFIIHNLVQAIKQNKESYAFKIVLLVPIFIYFANVI